MEEHKDCEKMYNFYMKNMWGFVLENLEKNRGKVGCDNRPLAILRKLPAKWGEITDMERKKRVCHLLIVLGYTVFFKIYFSGKNRESWSGRMWDICDMFKSMHKVFGSFCRKYSDGRVGAMVAGCDRLFLYHYTGIFPIYTREEEQRFRAYFHHIMFIWGIKTCTCPYKSEKTVPDNKPVVVRPVAKRKAPSESEPEPIPGSSAKRPKTEGSAFKPYKQTRAVDALIALSRDEE